MTSTPDLLGLASFHCTSLLQLAQLRCGVDAQTTRTTDADVHMLLFSATELCRSLRLLAGHTDAASNLTALLAMPTILPATATFVGTSTTTTTTTERRSPSPFSLVNTASATAASSAPSSPLGQAWSPLSSAPSSPHIDSRSSAPTVSTTHHHHQRHQFQAKLIDKTTRRSTTTARTGTKADTRTNQTRSGRPRQRAVGGGGVELPHVCVECLTSKTSQWRFGPHGPSTLCNACGLKWRKTSQQQQRRSKNATTPQRHSQSADKDATVIVID